MKSILKDDRCEKVEKPFPKLMILHHYKLVVLFSSKSIGTVVHKGTSTKELGHHQDFWGKCFVDYEGSDICLNND